MPDVEHTGSHSSLSLTSEVLPEHPGMLMIGAAGRNAGKTLLACEIIRRHSLGRSVVAAKVTTVHEGGGPCPRGNKGCGVCSSLTGPYTLTEERGHVGGKDTTRLLAAGASPVYWLCARPSYLGEGTSELMASVPRDAALVVESNSLRRVVEPGLFVLVQHEQSRKIKPSCREVWPFADAVVRFDGERFDHLPEAFSLVDGRWALRRHATAIVLAGGKSSRMGRDKALLPIGDLTMIEYIVAQLRPHFSQILVSSNDPERYAFLGLEVVPDRSLGKGPMMAVASTLERASYDLSFVIPCDVPRVHIPLMNRLLRAGLAGAEVAVPVTPESHYEPLFAVYRRSVRTLLDRALAKGERRLYSVYDDCDTAYFQMREADQLHNVNTTAEYEKMLADDPSLSCS